MSACPPAAAQQRTLRYVSDGLCVTNTSPEKEVWSCTRDEVRPLEAGIQAQVSNHRKGSRFGSSGTGPDIPCGRAGIITLSRFPMLRLLEAGRRWRRSI
jgi:hypothetical protein